MRWMRGLALGAMIVSASPALSYEGLRDVHVLKVAADEPGAFCADFLLSKRQAALSLEQSSRVTQEQYLQQFEFLPCYVQGTARLGGGLVQCRRERHHHDGGRRGDLSRVRGLRANIRRALRQGYSNSGGRCSSRGGDSVKQRGRLELPA